MNNGPQTPLWERARGALRPWHLVLAGVSLTAVGWLLAHPNGGARPLAALPVLLAGVFLAGVAVHSRLKEASWDLDERVESAGVVAVAAFSALLAYFGVHPDWDSGHLFFGALFLVGLGGSVLIVLPSLARRIALSLIVVFHFGGMLTAVTSVDPPNGQGPWVAKQLWTRVYRPYLEFLYMTNAYHFYSPNPGPPSLLWFAVHYSDGTYQWVKFPDRANSPVGMHYQRMLAMPEHTFMPNPIPLPSNAQRAEYQMRTGKEFKGRTQEDIYRAREAASEHLLFKEVPGFKGPGRIPKILSYPAVGQQYLEPAEASKKAIASMAKHILWDAPRKEGAEPVSVKVYRITHNILGPDQFAQGVSPLEKYLYIPYFFGEYDRQGQLKDAEDPFLWWYIPIIPVPRDFDAAKAATMGYMAPWPPPPGAKVYDCLEMHAAGVINPDKDEARKR
jgi:hypothetical protein